jgi:hypothetical protein
LHYAQVRAPESAYFYHPRSRENCPLLQEALPAWDKADHIDLTEACRNGLLSGVNALWPHLNDTQRAACLQDKRFTLSPVEPVAAGLFLLPGGALALATPEGLLVADPVSAVSFTPAEAKVLNTTVRRRKDALTILHEPQGVVCRVGLPARRAPQCATILAGMQNIAKCGSISGPGLIQWSAGGAIVWALRPAPPIIALALRAGAVELLPDDASLPAELWHAAGSDACADHVTPGLSEMVNDLLSGEVSDDLRHDLLQCCIAGHDSLAASIGAVLSALPSCVQPDPSRPLGTLASHWPNGSALLDAAGPGHALFGIEAMADPVRLIGVLRESFPDAEAVVFLEAGVASRCATAGIDEEAALFVARRAGSDGRIGLILPCGDTAPPDLYVLTDRLAAEGFATVTVSAPDWGFRHCIDRDGREAGNAAWFGMGAGLDDLDVFIACDLSSREARSWTR